MSPRRKKLSPEEQAKLDAEALAELAAIRKEADEHVKSARESIAKIKQYAQEAIEAAERAVAAAEIAKNVAAQATGQKKRQPRPKKPA